MFLLNIMMHGFIGVKCMCGTKVLDRLFPRENITIEINIRKFILGYFLLEGNTHHFALLGILMCTEDEIVLLGRHRCPSCPRDQYALEKWSY